MKTFLQKQTIILLLSMVLTILLVFMSISYSYYVVNLKINDNKKEVSLFTENYDLKLEQINDDDSLSICKGYPIKDEVGLSSECSAFTFSLTNQNNKILNYYLNLEISNTELTDDDLKVAFASCGSDGTLCSSNSYDYYSVGTLSKMIKTTDTVNLNAKGYILSSGENFSPNDKNIYKIIIWQNYESTAELKKAILSISATSYTPESLSN